MFGLIRVSVNLNFSGVPQSSVLGPLFFILYTADMWNDFENKIISYPDNTTLYAKAASPSGCINVANSLNSKFNHGV